MSLSTCLHCGGHIPLGPASSNCCTSCGKHVMSGPTEPRSPSLQAINLLVAENARLKSDNAILGQRCRQLEAELRSLESALQTDNKLQRVRARLARCQQKAVP